MAFLGREEILEAEEDDFEDVKVNEWRKKGATEDAWVRVYPMSASQRSRVESTMLEVNQTGRGYERIGQIALKTVIWCVGSEHSSDPVFSESDVKTLGSKSSKPILRIRDAAFRLSGLAPGAVEEEIEDFDVTQGSDFDTD
ncbi:hypothetical protein [Streptomonospora litoralis]|uniref:Uncharacterized protein n=1 Tax=Streptomonospora litoralis TaxID=2498135 RepID=A0A4P6QBH5_9ACTN|nr:hypothetical protein [Streptomonospora litoralis]QBI56797.1 hypothetical protein EKD16_25280 [Streptomonospora litoralis]